MTPTCFSKPLEPAVGGVSHVPKTLGGAGDVCVAAGDGSVGVVVVYVEQDGVEFDSAARAGLLYVPRHHFMVLVWDTAGEHVHTLDICGVKVCRCFVIWIDFPKQLVNLI